MTHESFEELSEKWTVRALEGGRRSDIKSAIQKAMLEFYKNMRNSKRIADLSINDKFRYESHDDIYQRMDAAPFTEPEPGEEPAYRIINITTGAIVCDLGNIEVLHIIE